MSDLERVRFEAILAALPKADVKFLRNLMESECADARSEGYYDGCEAESDRLSDNA